MAQEEVDYNWLAVASDYLHLITFQFSLVIYKRLIFSFPYGVVGRRNFGCKTYIKVITSVKVDSNLKIQPIATEQSIGVHRLYPWLS